MSLQVRDRDGDGSSRFGPSPPQLGRASSAEATTYDVAAAEVRRDPIGGRVPPMQDCPSAEVRVADSARENGDHHPEQDRKRVPAAWIASIFAAKTTAAGLFALLVAFTFNLDQPYWALLTVFIVSQPQQSGLVLAKSFYRIIGTVIGAAVALLLVGLCAQERVLFLGGLALWIGLCTFGSQYARNWAAYSFVLSGYTVAIVGIPGALDAGNAFIIAVGRVTEISLGIIVAATVSYVVFPSSLAGSLRQAVAGARAGLADYAVALFGAGDTAPLRAKLLGQAIEIENLRASAVFEDRDIRDRSNSLRLLDAALINAVDIAQLLRPALDALGPTAGSTLTGVVETIAEATAAIKAWRSGAIGAAELGRRFVRARARLPLVRELCRDPSAPDEVVIRRAAAVARLREFFTALTAYADAFEVFVSGQRPTMRPIGFARSNDPVGALWTGLRAALAVFLVSGFWILTNWPQGSTAAVLGAVATARLATMAPAVPIAIGATVIFALSAIPAFIIVEVLLPLANGFAMFALAVAPMLFLCALLMAHKKTLLIGYLSALLFASTGQFLDRMVYDPVGFINTSIAAVIAAATAMVLWAVVTPATPEAARRSFGRAARKAFERIARRRPHYGLTEFETAMTEALDQLRQGLHPNRGEDVAAVEAGIALLGTGRELIRIRDDDRPSPAMIEVGRDVARSLAGKVRPTFDRARRAAQDAAGACLADLRNDKLGVAEARAVAREMVAFAAIRDELARGGELLLDERSKRVSSHAA
jgi:uncharacterized membrane protein YccC